MHIGIVVYGDLNRTSGGYLYDRTVVNFLRRRGDRVTVFSQPQRPYPLGLIDTFDIPYWRALARAPIDVLLQDELNHPSLALGNHWLRRAADYPIVAIVHHLRQSERRSPADTAISRWIERLYLQSPHAFIFNSEATRRATEKAVSGMRADRPSIVAPPSGHRFGEPLDPATVDARAAGDDPLRLAFVGNVIPRKRLHLVLRGLARVTETDWRLDVVGDVHADPVYTDRVRRLISRSAVADRVTVHGRLPNADLRQILERSHALAVPSTYEGYGIVYVEAMGRGLPVLASPFGGVQDVVEDGTTGFFVRSASDIAAAARRWGGDRALLASMGRAALQAYRRFPTWDDSSRRIACFLDDLVSPHTSAQVHASDQR